MARMARSAIAVMTVLAALALGAPADAHAASSITVTGRLSDTKASFTYTAVAGPCPSGAASCSWVPLVTMTDSHVTCAVGDYGQLTGRSVYQGTWGTQPTVSASAELDLYPYLDFGSKRLCLYMAESASHKRLLAQTDFEMQRPPAIRTLPVKTTWPADGATVAPAIHYTFQITTDHAMLGVGPRVEIATAPTLGQDGTLAEEYVFQTLYLTRGDAFPDTYTASSYRTVAPWPPGVYYWQVSDTATNSYSGKFTTPVYRMVVAAPQAGGGGAAPVARLGISEAKRAARTALRQKYRKRFTAGRGFRQRCTRLARLRVRCRVSWNHSAGRYEGAVTVTAISNARLRSLVRVRRH
jgi:hypothetical protein